jgi:hypothetical protein
MANDTKSGSRKINQNIELAPGARDLTTTGDITAGAFYGDGSNLTGISTASANDALITITAGAGLTGGGGFTVDQAADAVITVSHSDTSSQASVANTAFNVIQSITLDTYGHITAVESQDIGTAGFYIKTTGEVGVGQKIGLGSLTYQTVQFFAGTGLSVVRTDNEIQFSAPNATQWNTAYTYSQVGHLPLAGGDITGTVTIDGKLGVGVTPSDWSLGGLSAMQIENAGFYGYSTNEYGLTGNLYYNDGWKYIANGTAQLYIGVNGAHVWYTFASGTAGAGATPVQTMQLSTAGNLTISGTLSASGYNKTNWDTAYGWGDHALAGYFKKRDDIPSGANLNNYTTAGYYHQNSNSAATAGTNYPEAQAGMLTVLSDGVMVYQTYQVYNSSTNTYRRGYYNGAWYSWKRVWDDSDITTTNVSNWDAAYTYSQVGHLPIAGKAADSELLDGIDSTQFLRSDANDTLGGTITLSYSEPKFVFSDTVSGRSATIGMTDNYNMYLTSANGGNLYLGSGTTTFVNGAIESNSNVKGKAFLDYDNTGYYVDPASKSNLSQIAIQGSSYYFDRNANMFRWQSPTGYIDIGSANASWAHFYTDRPGFYFGGSNVAFDGNISGYGGDETASFATYYDSNNTARYLDPNGDSRLDKISLYNSAPINFYGSGTDTYTQGVIYCDTSGFLIEGPLVSNSAGGTHLPIVFTWRGGYNSQGGVKIVEGHTEISGSARSPIFYDLDNTGYYVNPASTSVLNTIQISTVSSAPYIALEGTRGMALTGVSSIGMRTVTDTWTDPNYHGIRSTSTAASWGDDISINSYHDITMRIDSNGNNADGAFRIYTDTTASSNLRFFFDYAGTGEATGSFRAPIFYDSNNTAHYVDPAGGSNIRNLYVGDSGSSWSDPGSWGTQLHVSNGPHSIIRVYARTEGIETGMYSHAGGQSKVGSLTNHDFSLIRNFTTGLTLYNGYVQAEGSSRAPIFYDSNDTTYYLDPSTSGLGLNMLGRIVSTAKEHRLGASTTWDAVGFSNLTNLHFQGHSQFWIGAGNGTWFAGTANTKNQSTGLAADASYAHDLLITTMPSTSNGDRGITFAVDTSATGSGGWRLGKWHSGDAKDSSKFVVDGQILAKAGYTDEFDYYADDYSAYYSSQGGNAHWSGDTNAGWHVPAIVASSAIQIQSGNNGTNTRKPQIQFHQYGYGGPAIEYDGPNKKLQIGAIGTSTQNRLDTFSLRLGGTNECFIVNTDYAFHNSDMRSPIFYDSANTGYYLDPASTSNLAGLSVANTISGSVSGSAGSVAWGTITSRPGWMTSASLVASHSNANAQVNSGFYENAGGGSNWPSQTWYNSINVRHSNQGNYHGFQVAMSYYDNLLWFRSYQGSGTFQSWETALATGGSTQIKSGVLQSNASLRAPIFYDSNNTGYYVDPASTTNLNVVAGTRFIAGYDSGVANSFSCSDWFRSNGATGWYNQTYAGGVYMVDSTWVRTYNNKAFFTQSTLAAGGDVIAYYSDERLKDKKGVIENPIEKVKSLNAFYYTNNEIAKQNGFKKEDLQIGLSAQEVQKIAPEIVTLAPFDMETLEDGEIVSKSGENYLTLNYAKLVPILVEAIKEQQSQIEELKAIVNGLTK